ncbi:MAG: hypothetical protein CL402_08495 [Acidiferrobacteraceae bacterium]|nr:hypothetical protein [Acidiferrobacteraceae bacterium]|tara:strand:+ start:14169 stop:14885 length:717 start_codon:yes stop_codon:yes gene_type:complete
MSKVPWVYCSHISDSNEMELPKEELRHLSGSLRRREGSTIVLFDGVGSVAYARLAEIKKKPLSGWVEIVSRDYVEKPHRKICIATALPKRDRQAVMLDFLIQLGITDFVPLSCMYSVAHPSKNSLDRWQRILIETCKQCNQPWLPTIHPGSTPENLLESRQSIKNQVILLADENGEFGHSIKNEIQQSDQLLVVGPEGGFTIEEREKFIKNGALPIRLSANNLRIEVAAIAIAALVLS